MKASEKIESGEWYWCKSPKYAWYNIIVRIRGDYPFLGVEGYDYARNKEVTSISEIEEVGPKIEQPD